MNFNFSEKYDAFCDKTANTFGVGKESTKKIISALLSSYFANVIYLPILGYLLILNYMAVNNFFSYDLMAGNFFAVSLFVLAMIFGLLLSSFALFSSVIAIYASLRKKNVSFKDYWPLLLINLAFIVFFILIIISSEAPGFPIFVLIVCFSIALYYAVLLFENLKWKIIAMVVLLIGTFIGIFGASNFSADLLSNGLKVFGVGGKIEVVIYDEVSIKPFEAKLLLVTPTNLYFVKDKKSGFIPLSRVKKMVEK
jgi:hypothetical protein